MADLNWSRCAGNGSCVQTAPLPDGGIAIRDSKLGDISPVLRFTPAEWQAWLAGLLAVAQRPPHPPPSPPPSTPPD